ncbi:MAG TPA: sensor histidine kinase [Candidatus Acidoferrales bacterium]|nr:sensor histidine kinase [Candidatus Acidoferrales bacterium]
MSRCVAIVALALLAILFCQPARAKILWSDPEARVVHLTGEGVDILGGKVKQDDKSDDVLYFKFHVDPISDVASEHYLAGFQLYKGDEAHLGVGNAMEAWGYSAFNTSEIGLSNKVFGEFNLNSAHPEPAHLGLFWPYEDVHRGVERTIVFKVQYVPGGDDIVTVWLDPNLGRGATDKNQPQNITTQFKADATFDQIRLRHNPGDNSDGGNGWIFSDMAIATSFEDFVVVRFWQTWWFMTLTGLGVLVGVGATVRIIEQKKFRFQLQRAQQESALERERARIAQDLHDDLGSSLTRISLLCGLLQADKDNPDQVSVHAGKLSLSADQTVRALEEIVWAVRPGSDTLQSLVDYITHFASELFDGNQTRCRMDLSHDLPALALPPDVRHNIFLIVKEALTNALKHANAREVRVTAKAVGSTIEILVVDDGKGFAPDATTAAAGKRNGLGNMRQRAETIGGKLDLQSAPHNGTSVRLTVNLSGENNKPPTGLRNSGRV